MGCPFDGERTMTARTCAACEYELDANAIKVTIGDDTVEVCCEECAQKLREAYKAAARAESGRR